MNTLNEIVRSDPMQRVGWALLHSVWQIAAVACLAAIVLTLLRRRSANVRYLVGCGGLAAMFLLPSATFFLGPTWPDGEGARPIIIRDDSRIASADPWSAEGTPLEASPGAAPPGASRSALGPQTATAPAAPPASVPMRAWLPARLARAVSPWLPWLVAVWAIGVLFLSARHLGGWVAIERLKRLGTLPAAEPWTGRLAELAERMKLRRPVRMLQSTLIDAPAVIGWLRPVLLAPVGIFAEMSPQQIDAVLAHELAHVRRGDFPVNLLQTLVETLLFYHPAVWWLSRRIRAEREHCCDDAAIDLCGSRVAYAEALAAVEQLRSAPRLALAVRGNGAGTALARVRRVLGGADDAKLRRGTLVGGTLAAVALVGLIAGHLAWAAVPTEAKEAVAPARAKTDDHQPRQHFALYRVLGHRNAPPFGAKKDGGKSEILFSDEGDGSRRFDAMRPEAYPLKGLILDKTPLLTEADIVGYVWPKHEIDLKPGARQRLLRAIKPSVWGVPFAVVAEGEPVYLGAFWTGASSYMANMPTISVDGWQWSLPEKDPHYLPQNAIRIELSRVLREGQAPPADPREDKRVREALKRAGKLMDRRPAAGANTASADGAWGDAVDGVKVRLTKVTGRKQADASAIELLLSYEAKNEGTYALHLPENGLCHQVEVDGQWYAWADARAGKKADEPGISRATVLLDFPPGSLQRDQQVEVAGGWFTIPKGKEAAYAVREYSGFAVEGDRGKELVLTPGKHRVRLAVVCPSARAPFHGVVRAVSQAMEADVAAQSGAAADSAPDRGKADGRTTLERLKSEDAIYEAAFTASGVRPGWPTTKWMLTMLDGEVVYEEQVVDVPQPREDRIGRFIPFRRTFYAGPKAQVQHDLVGRIQQYGPVEPWPEGSPGPATAGALDVARPAAATYMMFLRRPVLSLGRGYSRHITEVKDVIQQEDGRLKVTADGLDIACRPGAKWELLIEPDAAYLVRSAKVVDSRGQTMTFLNSGLKRYGSRCVPEKAQCEGALVDASFEIESASAEADVALLKRTKVAMRPPFLVYTRVNDRRVEPLYLTYAAGKTSPQGGRKDWDLGLEDSATADGIQWGRETNGLQAGLALDLGKRPYHAGELVTFRLHVRNLTDKPVALVDHGTRGWMPTIHDSDGKPVLPAGVFEGPVQRRLHTLLPGKVFDVGTIELKLDKTPEERAAQPPHAYLKPGTYRVGQTYRFDADGTATWSGELTTGDVPMVVAAEPVSDR